MTAAPDIRFCTGADGNRLAYSVSGSGPRLALLVLHNHDGDLAGPGPFTQHWVEHLSARHELLRFDVRGSGLSDRAARPLGLAACVGDLSAVAQAAGFEHFSVVALGYGANLALAFAAARPQAVDRLVIYGAAARGRFRRDLTSQQREDLHTVLTMLESAHDDRPGYGFAFRRVFYEQFLPDAPLALQQAVDRIIVARFSGAVAQAYAAELWEADQSPLAQGLTVPTLVLHALRDQFCPCEEGQRLAALIPGAHFVGVDSNHSLPLRDDADWPATAARIDAFLDPGRVPRPNPLTERQREVLRLVAQGHSDKEIARTLGLSHRTVEMHVARSLAALDCRNRAEAVVRSSAWRWI